MPDPRTGCVTGPDTESAVAGSRLKHRWRVDFNFLCGLTISGWYRLLRQNRFRIDPAYLHRAAIVTGFSIFNSVVAAWERVRYRQRMEEMGELPQPIFVLGHFRQGTTHLHNLLAQDPRFTYPDTYAVANPHTFLSTGRLGRRILGKLLPDTRPQDNMSLSFDAPQEDEYAIALFSLVSPYFGMSFPWNDDTYRNQFTLRDAPEEQVEAWKEAFQLFLRKLAVQDPRTPVLKSPTHTARVRLLLDLFPGAKFVHIHRDPYQTFQSSITAFHKSIWLMCMQRPDMTRVKESILGWYTDIYRAYFEDLPLIPDDRFCEVGFDELERDPMGTMNSVYEELGLPSFDGAEPNVRAYLDSISDYRKSRHRPLAEDDRKVVARRWAPFFTRWGYSV
jgi:hypothetical protein